MINKIQEKPIDVFCPWQVTKKFRNNQKIIKKGNQTTIKYIERFHANKNKNVLQNGACIDRKTKSNG